jgi:hypothetical protein
MLALHILWPLGEPSFRVLVETGLWRRAPREVIAVGSDEPMLGDRWHGAAGHVATSAVSIARSATLVWPWLAQMMRGAGIQGWPKLETVRCRSADYLVAGLGAPRAGESLCEVLGIVEVEAGREIVWQSLAPLDVIGVRLERLTLDYRIEGGAGTTAACRLTARVRATVGDCPPSIATHAVDLVHAILPGHQLARIKRCAEAAIAKSAGAHAARAAHQCATLSQAPRGARPLTPPSAPR